MPIENLGDLRFHEIGLFTILSAWTDQFILRPRNYNAQHNVLDGGHRKNIFFEEFNSFFTKRYIDMLLETC